MTSGRAPRPQGVTSLLRLETGANLPKLVWLADYVVDVLANETPRCPGVDGG